ncbi:MAG: hypothetical protein US31_C0008G0010 [Berkelbacteria bacterium GW2011_GWA1_36_9]|uniref:DUF218 domain-containing protein n=1 Tax=Berkelbacteria bacterium GW2011_GWA1_36_9 TaxID=1618331 RepID=A0A0G0FKB2_9BACT|nr:MAG: hypothetical protein US31_C0008G0010 [Berkelbacteria bacterium GW2011_GWA1_36_9]
MRYSEKEIKDKLKKEFTALDRKSRNLGKNVPAMVVLAAEETSVRGENKERIDEGIKIVNKLRNNPILLYLGTQRHNLKAKSYLDAKNVQFDLISSHFPANTKNQIVDLKNYLEKHQVSSVIIVSHIYHIPRIKRYCKMLIPKINITFWKIGKMKDYKRQVNEEIEKIIEYSKKGDLPLFP